MSDELLERVAHLTGGQRDESPVATAIDGLVLLRSNRERLSAPRIMKPALCVVVQGAKWTTFGGRRYDYGPGRALVVSVEMPATSRIVKASDAEPFLGLVLEFDLAMMRDVLERLDTPPLRAAGPVGHGVCVTDFGGPLGDCVLRLVRLLDTPDAIPIVAPLVKREICYWLLAGPHGGEVSRVVFANGHAQRVVAAIHALRGQFAETIRVDELAAVAQMSPSAFHRQFKALTSMTPLQYQKQLRLLEARHLMVTGAANAETAAYRVGYESASQFSREYARMFGAPPRRDVVTLKTAPADD
ncbi:MULTISPECIES: AraC family transcriptional regulator [unclassified Burkholderia]|uniref:AraC family transcriptional regulator n=1 Tax=unclassified Burkholderia TaxID=2613784 RepID=UPI0007535550|nr:MULTISPECIES: AraC family transcriptional regulator [unclassified Burkholderia]AOI75952.1 AraC family transcriptional regulator [Burkholderia sp. NRF60-BP8]KVA07246.1 AraC family transcriptional regulator [Burkholderia sp. NRF60-BP8]KVL21308.1 AraC family transcriptional regulator [Burkholderia sp. MSMB1826]